MESNSQPSSGGVDHGYDYHDKIATLIYLSAVEKCKYGFQLGSEISQKNYGAFDDIGLNYKDQGNKMKMILIQVKHKQSEGISRRRLLYKFEDPFNIMKYFHCFLANIQPSRDAIGIENLVLLTNCELGDAMVELVPADRVNEILKPDHSEALFYKINQNFIKDLCKVYIEWHCSSLAKTLVQNLKKRQAIKIKLESENVSDKVALMVYKDTFSFNQNNNLNCITGVREGIKIPTKETYDSFSELFLKEICKNIEKSSSSFKECLGKSYTSINLECLNKILENKKPVIVCEDLDKIKIDESLDEFIRPSFEIFADLFIFTLRQPEILELDAIIKSSLSRNKLFESTAVTNSNVNDLIKRISDWRKHKGSLLTNDDYLKVVESPNAFQAVASNPLCIKFTESCLVQLRDDIVSSAEKVVHIIPICHPDLPILKMSKVVEMLPSYHFIEILGGELTVPDVQLCEYVVLLCRKKRHDHPELAVLNSYAGKIIVIGCDDEIIKFTYDEIPIKTISLNISINEIQTESFNNIMSRKIINFQGNTNLYSCFELMELFSFSASEKLQIANEMFFELCTMSELKIGQDKMHDYNEIQLVKTLNLKLSINIETFKSLISNENYHFAIEIYKTKPITVKKLQEMCGKDVEVIENLSYVTSEKDFDELLVDESKIYYFIKINNEKLSFHKIYNCKLYSDRRLSLESSMNYIKWSTIKSILYNDEANRIAFVFSNVDDENNFMDQMDINPQLLQQWKSINKIGIAENSASGKMMFAKVRNSFDCVYWLEWAVDIKRSVQNYFDENVRWTMKRMHNIDMISGMVCENEFRKMTNRNKYNHPVVISDKPGMGKSTILSSISYHNKSQSFFVIRIDFKNYLIRKLLKEWRSDEVSYKCTLNFLCKVDNLNLKTHASKFFLEKALQNTKRERNRLIFILDAYDEVPVDIKPSVDNFLQILTNETTSTVYLATREHYARYLTNKFTATVAHLEEIEIESFVNELLTSHLCLSYNYSEITKIKEGFHTVVSRFQNNTHPHFLRNPLHLRMLCQISVPYIINGSLESFFVEFGHMNQKELIENFIEYKLNVYFEEKTADYNKSDFTHRFYKCHAKLAFMQTYPECLETQMLNVTEDILNIEDELLLVGLLCSTNSSGSCKKDVNWFIHNCSFIHPTFCDYFTAYFIIRGFEQYKVELTKLWMQELPILEDYPYEKFRFLDNFLANTPLIKAIFEKNSPKLKELLDSGHKEEKDLFCRSPLHYATLFGDNDMIKLLKHYQIPFERDVRDQTPLDYAAFWQQTQLEALLSHYVSCEYYRSKNIFQSKWFDDEETNMIQVIPMNIFDYSENPMSLLEKESLIRILQYCVEGRVKDCLYLYALLIKYGANFIPLTKSQNEFLFDLAFSRPDVYLPSAAYILHLTNDCEYICCYLFPNSNHSLNILFRFGYVSAVVHAMETIMGCEQRCNLKWCSVINIFNLIFSSYGLDDRGVQAGNRFCAETVKCMKIYIPDELHLKFIKFIFSKYVTEAEILKVFELYFFNTVLCLHFQTLEYILEKGQRYKKYLDLPTVVLAALSYLTQVECSAHKNVIINLCAKYGIVNLEYLENFNLLNSLRNDMTQKMAL